jgi:hypothetical protein
MALSTITGIYLFLLFIFQCRPVAYFWGQYAGMSGSCIDPWIVSRSVLAYSIVSCCTDWTFCILPVSIIWNIQMNPRTKASVLVLFSLGAMWAISTFYYSSSPSLILSFIVSSLYQTNSNRASTTTIIRFPYLKTFTNKADFLYATTNVGILSTSEIGIGVTTSALATLRPLFRRFLGHTRLGSTPVELSP